MEVGGCGRVPNQEGHRCRILQFLRRLKKRGGRRSGGSRRPPCQCCSEATLHQPLSASQCRKTARLHAPNIMAHAGKNS
jgi:hypothetical protein